MPTTPIILWFRRDLRLGDHDALTAACASGRPVIPLFIHDELVDGLGAAPKFRLGLSVGDLAQSLADKGSRLTIRKGNALAVLREIIAQTGAGAVYWSRLYDPDSKERDTKVKAALKEDKVEARSFAGHVLFEPWTVETKTGGFYKVYTPMWKSVRNRDVPSALPTPGQIPAPAGWPASENLDELRLGDAMQRGADGLLAHCTVGERAASSRLGAFIANRVADYARNRDLPAIKGTSGLSENLTYGEISPRVCWHAGWRAMHDGKTDAEVFLKELVWREFAYHLAHHTPRITTRNWKPEWDDFPWNSEETAEVTAWKQGRTGIQFVDAAMREMYVTGVMHNRGRMIVASYLTKHLLSHWKIGLDWFADCLIDWDPCSNAMGWQWSAGSGPDATPYFRVFNPVTQLDKFDKNREYASRWLAEPYSRPSQTALSYFDMVPKSWQLSPNDPYPAPIVAADVGRKRALEAYAAR
ncbi:cryptochrome/photolyase family protein [Yoonia sediminilitoris]|uniref:Deoxyribodipyrimidine photo-lyase n=1 Tax=Yoonia sediminilitoris TaxID=1286148 RepID=A0A2T6K988_9RHOB|nr:deoxyribodipyrimidine photo-lyase [Yoonia sediminilitoris]PUB11311.1 deoxyribodipyrimidine photo-lyase [Yoonia sediminilitoris]RCW91127.1 deoxyribodipyrimidine photo-lyase [Yoonia sediminilitoris]